MIKLLLILLPFTIQAQDTIRMRIPVADTSKTIVVQTFINGYEVYKTVTLGEPAKLMATLDSKKKPIGKPYIKTGTGIPPLGFLWADLVGDNELNQTDKASGLSVDKNTMQGNPPNGWALVRSTQPAPGHVEFFINSLSDNCNIGLTPLGSNLNQPIGVDGFCYDASGNKETSGNASPYGTPYKTGDYVDMYYKNGVLLFSVNGVSQGVAFTVPAGLYVTVGTSQKSIITVKFDGFVYE